MQSRRPPLRTVDDPAIVAIIKAAAARHGVPRQYALAFAWIESKLNPAAEGDLKWHEKQGGQLYRRHVLENSRYSLNPARNTPQLWHSYGLYQLLACFFVGDNEHPRRLLNPIINADRGCKYIARLLKKTNDDVRAARLAYVGCGHDGRLCDERTVTRVVDALHVGLNRYAHEADDPRRPHG
jgi:hypothetical protein